jgi:hypothetical protein
MLFVVALLQGVSVLADSAPAVDQVTFFPTSFNAETELNARCREMNSPIVGAKYFADKNEEVVLSDFSAGTDMSLTGGDSSEVIYNFSQFVQANVPTSAFTEGSTHTLIVACLNEEGTWSRAPLSVTTYDFNVDRTAPVLTLTGDNPQTIEAGTAYTELGATATDSLDGDVTASIVIDSSTVNTTTSGTYTVTYNVMDAHGNAAAQATRTVNVVSPPQPNNSGGGSGSQVTLQLSASRACVNEPLVLDVRNQSDGKVLVANITITGQGENVVRTLASDGSVGFTPSAAGSYSVRAQSGSLLSQFVAVNVTECAPIVLSNELENTPRIVPENPPLQPPLPEPENPPVIEETTQTDNTGNAPPATEAAPLAPTGFAGLGNSAGNGLSSTGLGLGLLVIAAVIAVFGVRATWFKK